MLCGARAFDSDVVIHKSEDFEGMRKAGRLARAVLDYITPYVQVGVSTEKLDELCHNFIISNNAIPAPLGYRGYPKSICTSINHVVCHGIPSGKTLISGDQLNIDVSVILDGWFGDTSRMFTLGKQSARGLKLIQVTYDALMFAIDIVRPGVTLGDIGFTIQSHAEKHGFSVVRDFCGHGIGREFHMAPSVLHYGKKGDGLILKEGMFFTIEPMINAGKYETIVLKDGWTAVTRDKSLSAQWEHMMGVTGNGVEVFTA